VHVCKGSRKHDHPAALWHHLFALLQEDGLAPLLDGVEINKDCEDTAWRAGSLLQFS
jgi:hypothetical protein